MTAQHGPGAEILQSITDSRLVEALEANTAAAYADLARNPQGDVYSGPDMVRFVSGLPVHIFNGVAGARLAEERLGAILDETLGRFKARAVPMIWWVGPSDRPEDLGARLEAHGLSYDGGTPGMAVEIAALSQEAAAIPSLSVTPVTTENDVTEWARVAARGFGMPEEVTPALVEMGARHCLGGDSPWAYYLGRLEGQPVATAMMYPCAGVAGIYCVATVPEARRRGIGAELTRVALERAGEQGYRVGILQASGMGFPVYYRMGFETVLTFQLYSWTPPQG
ncbi:MAG TPA: GNAT family N-acetyltransferase [Ktedonobacterales bacterium]|nr:GNAT family N-acetyltransferase [Ktedonobacterales bacterium]